MNVLQAILILTFPFLSQVIARKKWAQPWLSAIVLCYGFGIVLRNAKVMPLNDDLSTTISEIGIVMAIPLLLYSTNVFQWFSKARTAFLSFGLFILSGAVAVLICTTIYAGTIENVWQIGGMTMGLYTGGTPNMQAIGMAIGSGQERIILLNTADIIVGAIYLLFLTSVAQSFFGLFLPKFKMQDPVAEQANLIGGQVFHWKDSLKAIGLTLLVIGCTMGLVWFIRGDLSDTALVMLTLTACSIAASFSPAVQRWESTFETAEYFLLVFSVALGMLADFSVLVNHGSAIIVFAGLSLLIAVVLHSFMSYLLGIDRDTTMIVATAALYGPPFVGQVASVIGNKNVVFSGIIMGLLGYMAGNLLGISMAYLLETLAGL